MGARGAVYKTHEGYVTDIITDLRTRLVGATRHESNPSSACWSITRHHTARGSPMPGYAAALYEGKIDTPRATQPSMTTIATALRAASGGPDARRPPTSTGDRPQTAGAGRGTGPPEAEKRWKLPALHQGLPALRGGDRRQRRAPARLPRRGGDSPRTPSSSTPPIRASSSATTAGTTSASCTRSRCACRSSSAIRAHHAGHDQRRHRHQRRLRTHLPRLRRRAHSRRRCRASSPPLLAANAARLAKSMYYRYWMHAGQHYVSAHYGIGTQHHKLIYYYGDALGHPGASTSRAAGVGAVRPGTDPRELHNVFDDPAYAAVVVELRRSCVGCRSRQAIIQPVGRVIQRTWNLELGTRSTILARVAMTDASIASIAIEGVRRNYGDA